MFIGLFCQLGLCFWVCFFSKKRLSQLWLLLVVFNSWVKREKLIYNYCSFVACRKMVVVGPLTSFVKSISVGSSISWAFELIKTWKVFVWWVYAWCYPHTFGTIVDKSDSCASFNCNRAGWKSRTGVSHSCFLTSFLSGALGSWFSLSWWGLGGFCFVRAAGEQ